MIHNPRDAIFGDPNHISVTVETLLAKLCTQVDYLPRMTNYPIMGVVGVMLHIFNFGTAITSAKWVKLDISHFVY